MTANTSSGPPSARKILISFDIEGICGVSTWAVQGAAGGRDFERFRLRSTREVNAAIEGALEAGVTEVVVCDSHGDAQNLLAEALHPQAILIQGLPRPLGMLEGIDSTFEACVFVGFHSQEGAAHATLSHTMSTNFFDVRIDGQIMGELQINALLARSFGVPLVFVSGDESICEDARKLDPGIVTVPTKQAISFYAARMRQPSVVIDEIRSGVRHALETPPARVSLPRETLVTMDLTYKQVLSADVACDLLGVTRIDGRTVRFTAPDIAAAVRHLGAMQMMNRLDQPKR